LQKYKNQKVMVVIRDREFARFENYQNVKMIATDLGDWLVRTKQLLD